jgi:imidazolonepropionase-like amidohydrolase
VPGREDVLTHALLGIHIKDNRIETISTEPLAVVQTDNVTMIDGGGRTLMPGLIDAHWHTMLKFWPMSRVMAANFGYLSIAAANASRDTLLRGFTTVRDAGANVFGVKEAIDTGLAEGPRIYPSGPYIGQTSGHGDFRGPNDVPENPATPLDYQQRVGHTLLADGVPEVIKRTREALRMGASQVKVMGGRPRLLPVRSPRCHRVHLRGDEGGRRGGQDLEHLNHGARQHQRGRPPAGRGRRDVDGARVLHR